MHTIPVPPALLPRLFHMVQQFCAREMAVFDAFRDRTRNLLGRFSKKLGEMGLEEGGMGGRNSYRVPRVP